jgi:hypothetical protein
LSNGETPSIAEAYDPKSLEHILAGTYPVEKRYGGDGCFYEVLQKYNVTIFRPELMLIITRYLQEISVLSLMVFYKYFA